MLAKLQEENTLYDYLICFFIEDYIQGYICRTHIIKESIRRYS